jgi:hypothetical protein
MARGPSFFDDGGSVLLALVVIAAAVLGIAAYDGIVNDPKRNDWCTAQHGRVFTRWQASSMCLTSDGRLLDFPEELK